jgi:ubiquinone/menaquinone biosynthesis C-methylase UbiE
MWSETIGYREYRHPYLKRFFRCVAEAIPLTGKEDLLDLGCGAGEVALGFAPFVASLTGMDVEQPMLDEASRRAQMMGSKIRSIHSKVEDAPADLGHFHLITMGRAHWFMHSPASLARLDQWLMPGGCILVCKPRQNPDDAAWHRVYSQTRYKWAQRAAENHPELTRLREQMEITPHQFFRGTDFEPWKQVIVRGQRKLELEHLIGRALGSPHTTRAVLGSETDHMIAELRSAMTPYFRDGPLIENHSSQGVLFRRRNDAAANAA